MNDAKLQSVLSLCRRRGWRLPAHCSAADLVPHLHRALLAHRIRGKLRIRMGDWTNEGVTQTGHRRWKNAQTGEIRYQETEPGLRGQRQVQPAPQDRVARPGPAATATPQPGKPAVPPQRHQKPSPVKPSGLTSQDHQKVLGMVDKSLLSPTHPVNRNAQKMSAVRFANLPAINSIGPTQARTLSATDQAGVAQMHAQVSNALRKLGKGQLADAHMLAAAYHNKESVKKALASGGKVAGTARVAGQAPVAKPTPTMPSGPVLDAAGWVNKHLRDNKKLTGEQRRKYGAAVVKAMSRMPDHAIKRIRGHLKHVQFFESARALTKDETDRSPKLLAFVKKFGFNVIAGRFNLKTGQMALDGESHERADSFGNKARTNAHEVYAHELTHAIDGPGLKLSRHPEWQRAWQEEIVGKGKVTLSKYAQSVHSEGFAEFGRLIYGTDTDRKLIEKRFPKCSAFFKKAGIW